MENQWYVYKHVRLDKNEPFYIGIGSTKNYARAFSRSIRNGIWEKITNKTEYSVEILYENLTIEEAKSIEVELISKYGKIKTGGILSNITDGGDGISGMKHSEETKRIIREKRKNQIFSDETKNHLSKVRMCNKCALGKKHSKEKNELKSKNQRGKFGGTIIRSDIEGNIVEFKSIKDAGDSIKTSYKNIWYACIKRKGKLYKGFYWEYKDDLKQTKNNTEISREFLHNEYYVNRKSVPKISVEINCSENKIYRLLKKYNLMND